MCIPAMCQQYTRSLSTEKYEHLYQNGGRMKKYEHLYQNGRMKYMGIYIKMAAA
jgi:hypothetical protein